MITIVTSEIVCDAFFDWLLFFQFVERNAEKNTKILRFIGVEVLLWLFIDVISFCTNLSYFPTFLTYNWGNIVVLSFMYYCEVYIGEKTDLNPWIFRVPKFLCLVNITLAIVSFVTGNIVTYENGKATSIYELPIEVEICQFIVIFYPSVVVFIKRKTAGLKSIMLFGFFVVIPLFATVFSNRTEKRLYYVFTAIALMTIEVFLSNESRPKNFEEHAAHEVLLENSARFFALEDMFEALYIIIKSCGLPSQA